jgi:uncharacterized protein (DUF1919 family)
LFIQASHYVQLLRDLRRYLDSPLTFLPSSGRGYPVGLLDDEIEVHFLHYASEDRARTVWTARAARVDFDRLWFKFDGSKDGAGPEERAAFNALPASRKVMFVRDPDHGDGLGSALVVPTWTTDAVEMLRRASPYFDVVDWLNGGTGRDPRGAVRSALARRAAGH